VGTGFLVVGATIVMLFVLVTVARARAGRAPGVPELLREPPEDVHPAELAILWGSFRRSSPLTAAMGVFDPWTQRALFQTELLHLAQQGVIEMEAIGRVTEPEDLRVSLRKQPHALDRGFVQYLFAGGTRTRTLGEVAASGDASAFSRWAGGLRTKVMMSMVTTQLRGGGMPGFSLAGLAMWGLRTFLPLSRLGRGWTAKVATLAAFGGGIAASMIFPSPLNVVLGLGCIAAGVVAVRLMPRRTPAAFRDRLARWAAFRRFLVSHAEMDDASAAAVVVWEKYLVYASAMQAAEEVEDQVRQVLPMTHMLLPWLGAPSGDASAAWVQSLGSLAPPARGAAAAQPTP
jgi:Predicted membrane protein (DUF2207) C-terminal domain